MFKSLAPKIKMTPAAQSVVLNKPTGYSPYSYPLSPSESFELISQKKVEVSSVEQTISHKISQLNSAYDECSPFFVCDVGEVKRQLNLWQSELPFITPYYAVKCNPNFEFIKQMVRLGVGFDCASSNEIKYVFKAHEELGINVNTNKLIYANPIKPITHLKFANSLNVKLTTVDSIEEIEKISNYTDGMNVLVRITTDDSSATCPLSVKFGADVSYATKVVDTCIELGVNIRGIAFHVGSGFKDPATLTKAVTDSRIVWDYINAKQQHSKCDILDVGGGFSKDTFVQPAKVLCNELLTHYADEMNNGEVQIISELGRFLSASCFTLATNVIGVRKELNSDKVRVYLNDGLYGNLNCILYDHQEVDPKVVTSSGRYVYGSHNEKPNHKQYSIWGPTCDGLDCIKAKCSLEHDVTCGDWIAFKNAGAYTNAAATSFNGFTNNFDCTFIDTEI